MIGFVVFGVIVVIIVLSVRSAMKQRQLIFDWANIIYPGITHANAAKLTVQQLSAVSKSQVQQHIRILDDCTELIQKTLDPDVFFMRLTLAFEHVSWIKSIAPYTKYGGFSISGNPDYLLSQLRGGKQEIKSEFLDRYWNSICENSMKFATQKTRIKKVMNALDPLMKHSDAIGSYFMDDMRLRISLFQSICDHPGQLQKDLVNSYPEEQHDKIRSYLYSMDKSGCIVRDKNGSTYTLSIP